MIYTNSINLMKLMILNSAVSDEILRVALTPNSSVSDQIFRVALNSSVSDEIFRAAPTLNSSVSDEIFGVALTLNSSVSDGIFRVALTLLVNNEPPEGPASVVHDGVEVMDVDTVTLILPALLARRATELGRMRLRVDVGFAK